ncbi:MAG TPA: hypothetical protein PLO67_21145 [Saprospiraceae bacterium]|nr:hypothetical protein [Saprospiraceae bacterium]HPI07741.1 hypothetical protein [Saprospiraceae bacterium]
MNATLARILSYLGHPLLILTYILLLLLSVNPFAFSARNITDHRAMLLLLSVFTTTFLLPGFGVALLKPLGFVQSLEMESKQERIGPYIITGIFYLWLFKNLFSGTQVPPLFAVCVLGATVGLFFAFFINIFTKISAHATGMGGLVAMVLLATIEWKGAGLSIPFWGGWAYFSMTIVLAITLLIAGLIGVARLALNAHVPADLYRGYAAGFAAVMIAEVLIR